MNTRNTGVVNGITASDFAKKERPVRLFLSYASEDEDIVQSFYDSFVTLSQMTTNVRVVWDKKSFQVGAPIPLPEDIEEHLTLTDYFIIVYSGTMKKSHSYTGVELGFYRGLIRGDEQMGEGSLRHIVPIYFGERPLVDGGALGINLQIPAARLRMSRDDFANAIGNAIDNSAEFQTLINLYQMVAKDADDRLPPGLDEKSYKPAEWLERIVKRNDHIKRSIVPKLMLNLYDAFSKRVRRKAVEQRLIQFEISKKYSRTELTSGLPGDTQLTSDGEAFSLFRVDNSAGELSWADFKEQLKTSSVPNAETIVASIERCATTAVSPTMDRDDEQIIRGPDGLIYRVIVTKQLEYYDGSKLLHMYFIPILQVAVFQTSKSAIVLAFIAIATKYRDIFLNPASDVSIMEFNRTDNLALFKDKVRNVVKLILMLEDQSSVFGLDQAASIAIYYGKSYDDGLEVSKMSTNWNKAKTELMTIARSVLAKPPTDIVPAELKAEWLKCLHDFLIVSNRLNTHVLNRAVTNLRKYLFSEEDYIPVPPSQSQTAPEPNN